ncbi:Uncharacterized protein dnm_057050 [Desulfonema magnum]|uniref:Uncharacterized protein n=1 Tax=Desulfonema magnum TaxID=45655 RepID=A0A975BQ97_9BACT|nr:Uncharacterized protein dnm_057050 [Desulfonema magnum]
MSGNLPNFIDMRIFPGFFGTDTCQRRGSCEKIKQKMLDKFILFLIFILFTDCQKAVFYISRSAYY